MFYSMHKFLQIFTEFFFFLSEEFHQINQDDLLLLRGLTLMLGVANFAIRNNAKNLKYD